MNNSYSEGVLVKNGTTGEVLTIDKMVYIIRSEVSKLYYTYPSLKRYYELDDIVQDIVCYYFSPMKKIAKTRLVHYSELYDNNINYLTNLFKLTSRQWLNMLCRNRDIKNNPISLNTLVGRKDSLDGNLSELQDFVKDNTTEEIILDKELVIDILNDLRRFNINSLFYKACGTTRHLTKVKFLNDVSRMKEVDDITLRQKNLLFDILDGYSKSELRLKYKDFSSLMRVLKVVLERRVESF